MKEEQRKAIDKRSILLQSNKIQNLKHHAKYLTQSYSIVKTTSRTMLPIITYKILRARITHVYTHVLYFLTHPVPVSIYELQWDTCRLREGKKKVRGRKKSQQLCHEREEKGRGKRYGPVCQPSRGLASWSGQGAT